MAWFGKKDKEKKEENNMTTLEQIRKAYEDLSEDDKKSFHQSISDRVHESIAAQERADGNEDSQSAAAREHEALGAEHATRRRKRLMTSATRTEKTTSRKPLFPALTRWKSAFRTIPQGRKRAKRSGRNGFMASATAYSANPKNTRKNR